MGVRCGLCSGLILPDHPPKIEPRFHYQCFKKIIREGERRKRPLTEREIWKFGRHDREDYIIAQLQLINELSWGARSGIAESIQGVSNGGVPDMGLDNLERKIDICNRIRFLDASQREVIVNHYILRHDLKTISKTLGYSFHRVDWLRRKGIEEMGVV